MTTQATGTVSPRLRCGIVLRTDEVATGAATASDWWVAGRAVDRAEDAEVELDEVERLYTAHGMWPAAFG